MICLLAATPHETSLLRQQLPLQPDPRLPGRTFSCTFCAEDLLLLHTGIGIASAAISLTRLLGQVAPELLVSFGCGGSYPGSGLENGDLALATSECFGDLGVADKGGFIPLCELGLAPPADGPLPFVQRCELENAWLTGTIRLLQTAAELSEVRIKSGPFVTVNTVSGTGELCRALEQRTAAICENMEGAALAQVAESFSVPLVSLRGISNPCGTRERAFWDLPAGMQVAQHAVLRLLKGLPGVRDSPCG